MPIRIKNSAHRSTGSLSPGPSVCSQGRHHLTLHTRIKGYDNDHTSSPMPHRMVSWRTNEPCASPSLSTASSVSAISTDTIVSNTHMMITDATRMRPADLGVRLTNFPGSASPTAGSSYVRHNIYFFKDGNVTFLVRDALHCASGSPKKAVGRRHTLLCSSILFLSGFGLLLHQVFSARRPRSRTFEYHHIIG